MENNFVTRKELACVYCKQEVGHHPTCINATDANRDKPDVALARHWVEHPNQSVWRGMKRDELGNPVLNA